VEPVFDLDLEGKNLTPVFGGVLIKPIEPSQFTAGGVAIPERSRPASMFAKVVAVGCGQRTEMGHVFENRFHPGQVVLYNPMANDSRYANVLRVVWHGEKLMLLSEGDILAIVTESNERMEPETVTGG